MTQPHGNYQLEVYFQGPNGVLPNLPMSFAELESRAEQALSPSLWSTSPAARATSTQRTNITAFEQVGFDPACSSAPPTVICPSRCGAGGGRSAAHGTGRRDRAVHHRSAR